MELVLALLVAIPCLWALKVFVVDRIRGQHIHEWENVNFQTLKYGYSCHTFRCVKCGEIKQHWRGMDVRGN